MHSNLDSLKSRSHYSLLSYLQRFRKCLLQLHLRWTWQIFLQIKDSVELLLLVFSIPKSFLRHIFSLRLLSGCAIGLSPISVDGFEWLVVFQFEVDFSFDQFLKIIFDGWQFCFHILEKNFAIGLIFDVAGRHRSPVNFIGNKEWLFIKRTSLLGESIDVRIGPFDFEFLHWLILKFIKIFIILDIIHKAYYISIPKVKICRT